MRLPLSRPAMAPLLDGLAAGLHWWLAELRGMIPSAMLQRVLPDRPTLVLDVEVDAVRLGWLSRGTYLACGRIEAGELEQLRPAPLAAALARFRPSQVELCLPKAQMLERRLTLPLASPRRLPALLRFELDRQTPFTPEQVYYDARIVARDPASRRMVATVALVKRSVAERALSRVRHWGLTPTSLTIEDAPGWSLDFQTSEATATPGARRHRLSIGLAALTLILGAAAWWNHATAQDAYADALAEALTDARSAAEATKTLQKDLVAREAKLAFLEHRLQTPSAGAVLEDLAARLPDDSWVTQFELTGTGMRLRGFSREGAQLPAKLADSQVLSQAQLGASGAGDQFDLSATLRPKAAP